MIRGSKNKGNWSEFYVLVYLLANQRLYSADEHLVRIPDYYFPVLKIMRSEYHEETDITNQMDYVVTDPGDNCIIEIYKDSELLDTKPVHEFQAEAVLLARDIPLGVGRQFTIGHGEQFLNGLSLETLAAPSTEVTDIRVSVWDTNTGRRQDMGFSIKSYLGGAPTLLNASQATNFVYEVSGISTEQLEAINAINTRNKIIDRMNRIYELGGTLSYSHMCSQVFSTNLMMIDTSMESIIAEMLLYSYKTNAKDCNEILNHIEEINPLNYPGPSLYTYKFKKFLSARALGMKPDEEWVGLDDANGGYIAVKANGEVLAYYLYDRNKFEQYLLDSTHFERHSTSRQNFASLYMEGDRMLINLNLDIRFYEL